MKYTVYILKSLKDNYYYTGLTSNLKLRFKQHNLGWEKTTRNHIPFEIIFTKEVSSRLEARSLEKKLKSGYYREQRKDLCVLSSSVERFPDKKEVHGPTP